MLKAKTSLSPSLVLSTILTHIDWNDFPPSILKQKSNKQRRREHKRTDIILSAKPAEVSQRNPNITLPL